MGKQSALPAIKFKPLGNMYLAKIHYLEYGKFVFIGYDVVWNIKDNQYANLLITSRTDINSLPSIQDDNTNEPFMQKGRYTIRSNPYRNENADGDCYRCENHLLERGEFDLLISSDQELQYLGLQLALFRLNIE